MLRKLIDWMVGRSDPNAVTLDHVPVGAGRDAMWLEAELDRAAARHGRPFRCAAKGLAREVIVAPGAVRVVCPGGRAPTRDELRAMARSLEAQWPELKVARIR